MMMAVSDALGLEFRTQTFTCEKHGPYQAQVAFSSPQDKTGRVIGSGCPACKKERDAFMQEAKRKSHEAEIKRKFLEDVEIAHSHSKIPLRFKEKTLDTYMAEGDGQQKALAFARWYVENWDDLQSKGTGLIFSGKAGAGKTHLACGIIKAINDKAGRAVFMTVQDARRYVKNTYRKDAGLQEEEAIDNLVRIGLLVLDEIGMDYGTDFNKALLFDMLNKRYENIKPTLLLTNLDPVALREYLGERLIDRMREGGGKMVTFTWESYRGKV
jgi:DNA replication protein DnaC